MLMVGGWSAELSETRKEERRVPVSRGRSSSAHPLSLSLFLSFFTLDFRAFVPLCTAPKSVKWIRTEARNTGQICSPTVTAICCLFRFQPTNDGSYSPRAVSVVGHQLLLVHCASTVCDRYVVLPFFALPHNLRYWRPFPPDQAFHSAPRRRSPFSLTRSTPHAAILL